MIQDGTLGEDRGEGCWPTAHCRIAVRRPDVRASPSKPFRGFPSANTQLPRCVSPLLFQRYRGITFQNLAHDIGDFDEQLPHELIDAFGSIEESDAHCR